MDGWLCAFDVCIYCYVLLTVLLLVQPCIQCNITNDMHTWGTDRTDFVYYSQVKVNYITRSKLLANDTSHLIRCLLLAR